MLFFCYCCYKYQELWNKLHHSFTIIWNLSLPEESHTCFITHVAYRKKKRQQPSSSPPLNSSDTRRRHQQTNASRQYVCLSLRTWNFSCLFFHQINQNRDNWWRKKKHKLSKPSDAIWLKARCHLLLYLDKSKVIKINL